MSTGLTLSVLDLVPVRTNQTTAQAVSASVELAKVADEYGYHRYWLAEHHNMPAVAATSPPVLIALIGSATTRIRVGSGGVMLPNHAPLVVAEQFALLEAAFPGRVDLGIGRAPGTDPVTSWALRGGSADGVQQFPEHVRQICGLLAGELHLDVGGRAFALSATPKSVASPQVWLLGSSDYSALLAAERGLPYVFAHHFFGKGTAEALALYRENFRPSPVLAQPRTFLTVNAVVAETDSEAAELARPHQVAMGRLRSGGPLAPQPTVEQSQTEAAPLPEDLMAKMLTKWVVGSPATAIEQIRSLAAQFGTDEVMINPVAGARDDEDPSRCRNRETTLRLVAQEADR